jgi:riboflavin kinase/FMN adenylyltransferase
MVGSIDRAVSQALHGFSGMGDTLRQSKGAVFTPGNHDGVHLGHQALLRSARALGEPRGLSVTALTFDPHPASVLSPERAPERLTSMSRRRELLLRAGADEVAIQRFDLELASSTPEGFLRQLEALGARGLVVGPDFRFGKDRAGDIPYLQRFAAQEGWVVQVEPKELLDGERVSSSAARAAVAAGDVTRASKLLGHLHELEGAVVAGEKRGRQLGFPTANLATDDVLHPADGVYAVVARVLTGPLAESSRLLGVANLGVRPTLAAGRSVEAHLFDFDGDLYGARLRLGLVARLRGERKFDSLAALTSQIALDCELGRDTLAAARLDEGVADLASNSGERGRWAWI